MSTQSAAYERESPASIVGGFLAALALFAGVIGIVWHPGRVCSGAIVVALVACAIGGPQRRLAAFSLAVAGLGWFIGMILAIATDRPLF